MISSFDFSLGHRKRFKDKKKSIKHEKMSTHIIDIEV